MQLMPTLAPTFNRAELSSPAGAGGCARLYPWILLKKGDTVSIIGQQKDREHGSSTPQGPPDAIGQGAISRARHAHRNTIPFYK